MSKVDGHPPPYTGQMIEDEMNAMIARFDNLLDEEMTSEEYHKMKKKSRWGKGKKKGGKKRVNSTHRWAFKEYPFPLYENKAEAENDVPDNHTVVHFDSEAEALRYQVLWNDKENGSIRELKIHPVQYIAEIGEYHLKWKSDFSYILPDYTRIIEDVKSYQSGSGKWYCPNGATNLKMKLFYEKTKHLDSVRFYLVSQKYGIRELYEDAKFAT